MTSPETPALRLAGAVMASVLLHAVLVFWIPYAFHPARERPASTSAAPSPLRVSFAQTPSAARAPSPARDPPQSPAANPSPTVLAPDDRPGTTSRAAPTPLYWERDALDRGPRILEDRVSIIALPLQDFPDPGTVVMQIWIGPSGIVDGVTYVGGSDLPAGVLATVIEGFKASRFVPAMRDGSEVGAMIRVEVNYGPAPD